MANIVHFSKHYFPDTGGIESVTVSLARGASRAGHNVFVVCFAKVPARNKEIIDGVEIIRENISIILASQPLGVKYFLRCLCVAREADIVHLHAPNMLGALCALFIPARTRLLVHWHSDVLNKGFLGRMLRPLGRALLRRANSIVVTSQVYADASETLLPFTDKITVVPIGVPDAKHEDNHSELPPEFESQIGGRKIVLAVGRLVPYKGFDVLIRAAQQLGKESAVVIVGDGPLREELQQAIVCCGVEDRVVLAGRISDSALHTFFKRAALYCLPSIDRAEAFGVVLVEAMTYGLPIVASDILGSGVPWVNQQGITGLNFPVGDVQALANAINKILDSEELRKKFSRNARERYLSEFTEGKSLNRILEVYEKLLATNN
jgi:glycosyltransferase involved in cell wall biosynthesis